MPWGLGGPVRAVVVGDPDAAEPVREAGQVKQSNGTFKVTGSPYGTAPYGIAIPKNNGMADPILAAVKHLMSDGTYTKILGKWGVRGGAISNPAINAAIS